MPSPAPADFPAASSPGTSRRTPRYGSASHGFSISRTVSQRSYLHDRVREDYDDRRLGDRVSFGKRFNYIWTGSLSLRAEQVKIGRVDDPRYRSFEILEAEGHHPLTSVTLQLRRDTTNPGVLPYKGTVTQASVEGYGLLGGDLISRSFSPASTGINRSTKT